MKPFTNEELLRIRAINVPHTGAGRGSVSDMAHSPVDGVRKLMDAVDAINKQEYLTRGEVETIGRMAFNLDVIMKEYWNDR